MSRRQNPNSFFKKCTRTDQSYLNSFFADKSFERNHAEILQGLKMIT